MAPVLLITIEIDGWLSAIGCYRCRICGAQRMIRGQACEIHLLEHLGPRRMSRRAKTRVACGFLEHEEAKRDIGTQGSTWRRDSPRTRKSRSLHDFQIEFIYAKMI